MEKSTAKEIAVIKRIYAPNRSSRKLAMVSEFPVPLTQLVGESGETGHHNPAHTKVTV
jgi:hypothetical protein